MLPIADEVRAGDLAERQGGDAAGLVAVGHAAVILAPGKAGVGVATIKDFERGTRTPMTNNLRPCVPP